jgi:hypothetical protein
MSHTRDNNTQDYECIAKYWEVIAACAWREYEAHGRGALLVTALDGPEDCIYLPLEMMKNPLLDGYRQLVERYDPRAEVVVIFLRGKGEVSAYKGGICERGTPPELHDRLKAALGW